MNVLKGTLRGRPRGRLGTNGSGKGRVRGRPRGRLGPLASVTGRLRGRPRRLGSSQGSGATLYLNNSWRLHVWSVRPVAIAGVCRCGLDAPANKGLLSFRWHQQKL